MSICVAVLAAGLLGVLGGGGAMAQHRPGKQGSSNVKILAHVPLGGMGTVADVEVEQDLSRPYAYVSRRLQPAGFDVIDLKQLDEAKLIYSWRIEDADLHLGSGAVDGKYFKLRGRYYYVQSFQFRVGGPDVDLGAVVFDVTGLPDTSTMREVGRLRAPDAPGGFHNIFAYRHSNGRTLLFATLEWPWGNVYDMERYLDGDPLQGLVGKIPVPDYPAAPAAAMTEDRDGRFDWHDFYVAYDPATRQDKFYGSAQPVGSYVFDVTRPEQPKLITSITGAPGQTRDHTLVATPDGRYVITESHFQYRPLQFYDLKPGLDGEVQTISRPIAAWTADWETHAHNFEIRWPYVFVAAYEYGMQVINMMDPTNPYTVGYYDTFDGPHARGGKDPAGIRPPHPFTHTADGAFGLDVRNADGLVVLGDFTTGFWALKMDGFDGWNGHEWGVPNASSAQDWENGPDGAPPPARVTLR